MRGIGRVAIGVLALGAWLLPAQAVEAAPGPAWKLSLIGLPTHLTPGKTGGGNSGSGVIAPIYLLTATNVGAGSATGPVTLSATFPEKVEPVFDSTFPEGEGASCSKVQSQTVTCTAAGPIPPSRALSVRMPVKVSGDLHSGETLLDVVASVESPLAEAVTASTPTVIDTKPPPFGFLSGSAGFSTLFTEDDGSASRAAGSHPNQLTVNLGFPVDQPAGQNLTTGAGHPRDIVTDLPQGVVVNPNATTARCVEVDFVSGSCPPESQVGVITTATEVIGPQNIPSPLYNMAPVPGSAATLGFDAAGIGIFVHLEGGVRSEGDFGLYAESNDTLALSTHPLENIQAQIWGDPSGSSHDQVRPSVDPNEVPMITMPSACSGYLTSAAQVRSWEEAEQGIQPREGSLPHRVEADATTVTGVPTAVGECSKLHFDPSLTLQPDTNAAESPAGMAIDLTVPQTTEEELGEGKPATSTVRNVTVSFPTGVALNPAAADGLTACTPQQIGMRTGVGEFPPHFTRARPQCPDASKIGTVEVSTPLLDHPVPGAVYVAQPYQNPFGTLLAVYVVIDSPQDGIAVKLAGKTEANPVTGQLTTSFREAPELPFSSFSVDLFGGSRAALRTPSTCGTYTTTTTQAPWSGTAPVTKTDSFQVTRGAKGKPCASSEAAMPNNPGFEAGTQTPLAAAYSPFGARLTRDDGEQQLRSLIATPPPGLTGKLAGIVTCSDAAIAAAGSRSGQAELASPSCPANSQIGQIAAGAGAGPAPYYTQGKVYLAGLYKGAPLSGVAITPAVAGPFDLGTVVVRAPARIDPVTAQLKFESDDFPHILQGIPLELRDARLSLDRPEFVLNPTSCDPMAITGQATALLGSIAPISQRFQVGGCRGLDYEPKLAIRLFGKTKRGSHPRLRAILTAKPGEANTARASVALPRSEFLENAHIQTVCTRVQFAADQCPQGSIYGHARAITPLLDEPLEGPVYLRSSSHELPDMVAALKGPPSRPIEIELDGRIDSVRGGIRTTFDLVPDQPVGKFILDMKGGRKGLIVNSRNVCARTYRAVAKFDGQNGKVHDFKPKLKASCGKHQGAKKKRKKHG